MDKINKIKIGEEPKEQEDRPQHRIHEHLAAYQSPKEDGTGIHADFKDKGGKVLFSHEYANIGAYWRHVEELRAFYLKQQEEMQNARTKQSTERTDTSVPE